MKPLASVCVINLITDGPNMYYLLEALCANIILRINVKIYPEGSIRHVRVPYQAVKLTRTCRHLTGSLGEASL